MTVFSIIKLLGLICIAYWVIQAKVMIFINFWSRKEGVIDIKNGILTFLLIFQTNGSPIPMLLCVEKSWDGLTNDIFVGLFSLLSIFNIIIWTEITPSLLKCGTFCDQIYFWKYLAIVKSVPKYYANWYWKVLNENIVWC